MIRLIEALNFRCLRYVRQPLGPFHVLVGPNASGKTTFLDTVSFLGTLVSEGLAAALDNRSSDFRDLVFGRSGTGFELAIEAAIPDDRKTKLTKAFDTIRYEVRIGVDEATQEVGIESEKAWLKTWHDLTTAERTLFPDEPPRPAVAHYRQNAVRLATRADQSARRQRQLLRGSSPGQWRKGLVPIHPAWAKEISLGKSSRR
jgi:predicted ATPase